MTCLHVVLMFDLCYPVSGEKSPLVARTSCDGSTSSSGSAVRPRRSGDELRQLWKKAIHQQVLLNRMERENARITGGSEPGYR